MAIIISSVCKMSDELARSKITKIYINAVGASRKKKMYIYIIRIAAMASSRLSGIRANLVITISARCQTVYNKNVKEMCKNEKRIPAQSLMMRAPRKPRF